MPVLLEHERIAEQAERLTGDPRAARTAEQHLQRLLRGRDEQEQRGRGQPSN